MRLPGYKPLVEIGKKNGGYKHFLLYSKCFQEVFPMVYRKQLLTESSILYTDRHTDRYMDGQTG